jgi:pilus assembly protein FimV
MKQKNTKKFLAVGVALAGFATVSSALTLGRVRGAVLLGQPLGLTVVVQAEADEAASDLCFDADVYYGDVRQEGGRVSVMPLRQEGGTPTSVKINVASPVDEPIVTVYLRSGCGQKTSRKYVLLSDLASDVAPSLPGDNATKPLIIAPVAGGKITTSSQAVFEPSLRVDKSRQLEKTKISAQVRKSTSRIHTKQIRLPPEPKRAFGSKSHLKLSILDLVDIRDPDLKLSSELNTVPSDNPQKREEALALWQSMNTSSQDVIKDERQQKSLADDLKSLREISGKNQRDLQEISIRLQSAESQRYANPLVYALGGLLTMALLGLGVLLAKSRSGRHSSPWWRSDSPNYDEGDQILPSSHVDVAVPISTLTVAEAPETTNVLAVAAATTLDHDFTNSGLDIDLGLDAPPSFTPDIPKPVQRREVSHSLHASLHAINTQEMLDVRQQADFFMTLGQHEEAIGLLEASIRESEASNPLVYLDLLKVLHTLSRKPAFDHYRSEFNAIFTGRVEAYATFGQPGNALDAYPQICGEISELWGSDTTVDFLEQCMVRRPEDAPELYFDLDAFRDLILLHAVASRISLKSASDSGLMPFSALKITSASEAQDTSPVLELHDSVEISHSEQTEVELSGEVEIDLDLSHDDHNLIDFDASVLAVDLPHKEK